MNVTSKSCLGTTKCTFQKKTLLDTITNTLRQTYETSILPNYMKLLAKQENRQYITYI